MLGILVIQTVIRGVALGSILGMWIWCMRGWDDLGEDED